MMLARALKRLIDAGTDVNHPWLNPEQPSAKDGCTALSEAVSLNYFEVARCLVEHGAALNNVDRGGLTPLMKAAYHGRWKIAEMLVKGADVNYVDKSGNSILHICCKNGFVHNSPLCVVALINCGSDIHMRNNVDRIPLHFAATWATDEIVSLLRKPG